MVERFNEKLIEKGDGIVAGVSGGADSVCLLLNLCEQKEKKDIGLCAVYVDHGIRGEASEKDGLFVEELCKKLDIPFFCEKVDVPAEASDRGVSVEEAARDLRYERLLAVAKNQGFNKLAIAHNADDNAETIIFQMVRGTGVAGLKGMDDELIRNGIVIIRPLLSVTRAAVESYLKERNQSYVTDATNLSDDYTRNRIRHRVIPELININNKAIEHINDSARALRELELAEESAERLYEEASGGRELSVTVLKDHSPSLRRSVIRLWIRDIGKARDVSRVHYEAIDDLITNDTGKSVDLPGGQQIEKVYDRLRLKSDIIKRATDVDGTATPVPFLRGGEKAEFSMDGWYIRMTLFSGEDAKNLYKTMSFQKNYAKYYDYGKIRGNMVIRHRRDGDYLVISPKGTKKPLARYFVDEKIPRNEREEAWLLCEGSKVILAAGYRGSEDMRVDDRTQDILQVEYWRT